MTAYTDPTVAFTRDMASGTTAMFDALAGFTTTQRSVADHARAVDSSRHTSVIKASTSRRFRFPRWFVTSGGHMSASASRHLA